MPDPLQIATASVPGGGKTTDAIFSFLDGIFIHRIGGLTPAIQVVGRMPTWTMEASTLEEATGHLDALTALDSLDGAPAVIVDDVSLDSRDTIEGLRPFYPKVGDGVYEMWREVRARVDGLGQAAYDLIKKHRVHVVFTGHLIGRDVEHGHPAGLRIGSHATAEPWAGAMSCLYILDKDGKDPRSWKGRYKVVQNDRWWATKDRTGIVNPVAPQNLAEILRASGHTVPRAAGLEWMEEWVEAFAMEILAGKGYGTVRDAWEKQLADIDPHTRRWVRRDGYDRALIRSAFEASLRD